MSIAFATTLALGLMIVAAIRYQGNRASLSRDGDSPAGEQAPDRLSSLIDMLSQADSTGDPIDTHQPGSGSWARTLSDAGEAFQARLTLTSWAVSRLDLQYYGFQDDDAGRQMLAALQRAAERGVQVRLLLDDIDLENSDRLLSRLSREHDQIHIRVFNPLWLRFFRPLDFLLRFPRSSRRMHNKSFTADGQVCIVGGRNIGDAYFRLGGEVSFTDFDMLGFGRMAADITACFERYWCSRVTVDIRQVARAASDSSYDQWQASLRQASRTLPACDEGVSNESLVSRYLSRETGGSAVHACKASVHADPPKKVLGRLFDTDGNLAPLIGEQLRSAEHSLVICSPYFIPHGPGMAVFEQLRARGVEVTILTNSYAANDVLAVHAGYVDYRERMLELGVNMYEFKPGHADGRHHKLLGNRRSSLHAKTFVIDDQRLFVGSFNLDPRSAIHNTELGILIDSASLASTLSDSLTDRIDEIAYHLDFDERHRLRWRERDDQGSTTWYDTEPHTTALRRAGVYLLSWLPVEWLL